MTEKSSNRIWNQADRDLLITLNAKVDNLSIDVKSMSDNTTKQIAEHEVRIRKAEEVIVQTDLLKSYKDFLALKEEVHDFKTTANVIRVMAGIIGGAIFFIITQLPNIIKLIFHL